ncbi:MAG: iron-containing redox enzyme family protein [Candidatus Micrarchaeota archaeon]
MSLTIDHKPRIHELVTRARAEVSRFLIPPEKLNSEQAKHIIRRYTAAFYGNFVNWCSAAIISSRSNLGNEIATANWRIELTDNHPFLLLIFARTNDAYPQGADYEFNRKNIELINEAVIALNSPFTFGLIALLENTSLEFIPYLKSLEKRLGMQRPSRYLQVHGEADAIHASAFLDALVEEVKIEQDPCSIRTVEEAKLRVVNLIRNIFTENL